MDKILTFIGKVLLRIDSLKDMYMYMPKKEQELFQNWYFLIILPTAFVVSFVVGLILVLVL